MRAYKKIRQRPTRPLPNARRKYIKTNVAITPNSNPERNKRGRKLPNIIDQAVRGYRDTVCTRLADTAVVRTATTDGLTKWDQRRRMSEYQKRDRSLNSPPSKRHNPVHSPSPTRKKRHRAKRQRVHVAKGIPKGRKVHTMPRELVARAKPGVDSVASRIKTYSTGHTTKPFAIKGETPEDCDMYGHLFDYLKEIQTTLTVASDNADLRPSVKPAVNTEPSDTTGLTILCRIYIV